MNPWAKQLIALIIYLTTLSAFPYAEVEVVDVDNTLKEENFNVGAVPMRPPNPDAGLSAQNVKQDPEIDSEKLPNKLPSKSIDVSAEANTSVMLLNRIDDLEKELQTLRGQLEVHHHKLSVLEKKFNTLSHEKKQPEKTALKFPKYFRETSASGLTKDSDEKSYLSAYRLVKSKEFQKAITALRSFIQSYPKSAYLANAYYWLGELHLAQGQIDQALSAFDAVIHQFPLSNKVPGATLKKGFALYEKGDWKGARKELRQVRTQYPDTTLSRLALGKLSEMDQRGV